ncbi:GNAT family N-acetyltransferase [Herbiconiux sp. VKM Ac-2851]|uniref:GNAT family N-acetyltransferase n=1 Tax=Herbiconiux sp. VKM Ac-2851 TaxID=2739025 RepID=UPI0015650BD7|nr:GNAT family N-acetyltransferase [Herbiconiux sp. VKM Ac-2851]NQX34475.1 GNAT family N-acetyltransferase [Herbiconiux sp. VKM Ac-2851]
MEPTIRSARAADAEQLALLSLHVWDEAYRDVLDPVVLRRRHEEPASSRKQRWAARLATDHMLVALQDLEVVGFARTSAAGSGARQELLGLYTRAPYWRSGLGSRLLVRCLNTQAAHLWLFDGNERALRFYERHGFSLDGARRSDPPFGMELHMIRN